MNPCLKSLLTASILLLSASLWAQEVYHEPDLLARLSYQRSMIAPEDSKDVRQVCIAVSREGDYRIVRFLDSGLTQRLKGKMQKETLEQLKTLLDSADFRALPGDHGGLIREYAETFGAEIPILGSQPVPGIDLPSDIQPARRLHWLNADGESPFPRPLSKVVDWLKHFEPTNGKDLEYVEYRDVCPTVGLRLLQPSEASNQKP